MGFFVSCIIHPKDQANPLSLAVLPPSFNISEPLFFENHAPMKNNAHLLDILMHYNSNIIILTTRANFNHTNQSVGSATI